MCENLMQFPRDVYMLVDFFKRVKRKNGYIFKTNSEIFQPNASICDI